MGWKSLRPLQQKSFESITSGKNILITAGTASGKTEASLLPVLSIMLGDDTLIHSKTPVILYIAPLKALINDIYSRLIKLTMRTPAVVYSWHGDVDFSEKSEALKKSSIIITTPESLEGMMISGKIDHKNFFSNIRFILIDELHALIAGPRGAQLASIMERISALSRHDVQRIAMSATIGNPQEVLEWIKGGSSRETEHVSDDASTKKMLLLRGKSLENLKEDLCRMLKSTGKSIIFTSSKQEAEILYHYLSRNGFLCMIHHGSMGKSIREESENTFKNSNVHRIMIATTTLEMGIDIGDVSYVFFYSVPKSAASFMQRFGRAGRKSGIARAVIYVSTEAENPDKLCDEHLFLFGNIQLFKENEVEPIEIPNYYPQILAHQIISMILSDEKIEMVNLSVIRKAYPFKSIEAEDVLSVLDHLEKCSIVQRKNDTLRLGSEGDLIFSGRGLGDFVSVFDVGKEYTVMFGDREIGKIHYATFGVSKELRKVGFSQSFILAGKAWKITDINMNKKIVFVEPSATGVKPMWLGGSGNIAERFSKACRKFILNPIFPENVKIDVDVFDALIKSVEELRTTVDENYQMISLCVERKKIADYRLYTYAGEMKNLLISYLLPHYDESAKSVKSNWKFVKFRTINEFNCEEFNEWMSKIEFKEFSEYLEEPLKKNSYKIGKKLFQDRCTDLIGSETLVKAYLKAFWNILGKQ